jgi:hypothetical protein
MLRPRAGLAHARQPGAGDPRNERIQMSARRRSFRAPLLLLALCAVLATILYQEAQHPLGTEIIADAGAPGSLPPLPPDPRFAMPSESSFTAVLQRPLFSANRRPVHDAASAKASLAASADFTLIGVVISGHERYALVRPSSGDGIQRVKEGGELTGWSAVSIGSDRVLLRQGTLQREVVLDYKVPAPSGQPRKKHKLVNAPAQPAQPTVPAKGQRQSAPGGGVTASANTGQ